MKLPRLSEIYAEIIETPELERLKDISFLGILDYCINSLGEKNGYSNRYEHSLSVANLCLSYAQKKNLSEDDKLYYLLAGLLHDIGHCGFSHSLEPVFKKRFSITHHAATKSLIFNADSLTAIWNKYEVDPKRIINIIDGLTCNDMDKVIAKMPINFDTLDGISRAERVFKNTSEIKELSRQIFTIICENDDWEEYTRLFDLFWENKEKMYRSYIYAERSIAIELLFQKLLFNEVDLKAEHFFFSDSQLKLKFPQIGLFINDIYGNYNSSHNFEDLNDDLLLNTLQRNFRVNKSKPFSIVPNMRYEVNFANIYEHQMAKYQRAKH